MSKSSEEADEESQPANGSIITMTLKNNHLIVETEHRHDITRNGRETKMKYSPGNEGIFVVEVQQSAAYRPNKSGHSSPPHDPQISTNQALIHRPPEQLEKRTSEDSERSSDKFEKRALALSSTGLSISDLSMSSIGSHNVSYSYSSQVGYEQGPFGYPLYTGYDVSRDGVSEGITHDSSQEPLIGRTPTDPDKPVVTAAIFKQDSIIANNVLQGPGYCIEGSSDGPLLSDVQAREVSLQKLHGKNEMKLENGAAIQTIEKFESPINLSNPTENESPIIKNGFNLSDGEDNSLNNIKGKIIIPKTRADVYESVTEVISSGSPKFEKLRNEVSPGDNSYDSPPMITITEESEPRSDSNSEF
ncbi:unnamed protein product [Leptidea sinapis]|uniref:Uncharacterized protein n=1 Tax=Leptidea sinapis TaxID=189913 RepID=A0A5E4PZC5_9NEOP|nr:unnamed protein product [Leptidea sinapis]